MTLRAASAGESRSAFWVTDRSGTVSVLNDAQAGLGTGPREWRSLITRTLTAGGDGYCLHSTLQASPDTRDLLPALRRTGERCGPAIGDGEDFVHYDFTPANLLAR